ncbi:MAG: hypothetical protein LC641_07620 [Spirochaeta sp.]|nr:hypothetical protein [Spirochaeta sp.]
MNALLYPYHHLPRFTDAEADRYRRSEISSALLYFDSITIGIPGEPEELGLGSFDDIVELVNKCPIGNRSVDELSMREYAIHALYDWFYQYLKFRRDYFALLKGGIVRTASLAGITAAAKKSATTESERQALDMSSVLGGFLAASPDWLDWANTEPEVADAAFEDANASGSLGLSMYYWADKLRDDTQLETSDSGFRFRFARTAFQVDSYLQAVLSELLGLSVIAFRGDHLKVRERHLAKTATRISNDTIWLKLLPEYLMILTSWR